MTCSHELPVKGTILPLTWCAFLLLGGYDHAIRSSTCFKVKVRRQREKYEDEKYLHREKYFLCKYWWSKNYILAIARPVTSQHSERERWESEELRAFVRLLQYTSILRATDLSDEHLDRAWES